MLYIHPHTQVHSSLKRHGNDMTLQRRLLHSWRKNKSKTRSITIRASTNNTSIQSDSACYDLVWFMDSLRRHCGSETTKASISRARWNKVGETAIKSFPSDFFFWSRFTSCSSSSRVSVFFCAALNIFLLCRKSFSFLSRLLLGFSCSLFSFPRFAPLTPTHNVPNADEAFGVRESESEESNKVFHRIIKAQCRSYAGKGERKREFSQLFSTRYMPALVVVVTTKHAASCFPSITWGTSASDNEITN